MRQKIELFRDSRGEFRWRLLSSKRVIAVSSEGYSKKAGAKQALKVAVRALTGGELSEATVPIVDLTIKVVATNAA